MAIRATFCLDMMSLHRWFHDDLAFVDQAQLDILLNKSDEFGIDEYQVKHITKVFGASYHGMGASPINTNILNGKVVRHGNEQAKVAETFQLIFNQNDHFFFDIAGTAERVSMSIDKDIGVDNISADDSYAMVLNKSQAEDISIGDEASFSMTKNIDHVHLSDAIGVNTLNYSVLNSSVNRDNWMYHPIKVEEEFTITLNP